MVLSAAPAGRWADLPEDIAFSIASLLQEADVCALGACSRSWRSAYDADGVWEGLFRRRWPAAAAEGPSRVQGWKALYINQHERMSIAVSNVLEIVESSLHNGSLEAEYYLKTIAHLAMMNNIGFHDVQFFLFSRKHNAIINLIGLHYSIASLHISPTEVSKALQGRQVADRMVCVNLLKLGRWFYGFRLPDETESHKVSLRELTMAKGAEVLALLNRGAVHEVFRLRVSLVKTNK